MTFHAANDVSAVWNEELREQWGKSPTLFEKNCGFYYIHFDFTNETIVEESAAAV